MLGWLAAAGAPVLIHLWSRRKYREVPWAAVRFLQAALRRTSRRLQLQQWLLLILRTLIIVLVVLAVAEPYGAGSLSAGAGAGPIHKVLVVDDTYSMALQAGQSTRFAEAKRLAVELVRASGLADTLTIVSMAKPAQVVASHETIDRAALIARMESLAVRHAEGDLVRALALANEALESSRLTRGNDRGEVYFFTDLQRQDWDISNATSGEELRSEIASLTQKAAVIAVDVGASDRDNLAVTRLSTPASFVTTRGATVIEATLHQFGRRPRENCLVELLIGDVPVAEQTVDVPAGGDATVRFVHRFRAAGDHAIAVRAAPDRLPLDDTRWLALPVRDEVRVLCVEGKRGAAKFIAQALAADRAGASPLRPAVVSEGDWAELELNRFDAVFLCNVGQLSTGESERVARFAERGGGVLAFLGDQVRPASYNSITVRAEDDSAQSPNRLWPANIGQLIKQQSFVIDPLEYRHPIVAPFRGRERSGLLNTPVSRYFQLRLDDDRAGAVVVAALAGGDPWIVTAPYGRGRIVLVATDGSLTSIDAISQEPWTGWPIWPSFLPLIREMLAYAVGGPRDQWEHHVGDVLLPRDAQSLHGGETIEIGRPDGRAAAIQVADGVRQATWSYENTDLAGIYAVRVETETPRYFAVNVNTSESDLSKTEPQRLPPELTQNGTVTSRSDAESVPTLMRRGWQANLLAAAFGLLLVESLLAWLFGKGKL